MTRQEIEQKVSKLIVEQLNVSAETIKPESAIAHGVGDEPNLCADSLGVVELLMALEEAFEIEIPDDDAAKLRTVRDIVDYVVSVS